MTPRTGAILASQTDRGDREAGGARLEAPAPRAAAAPGAGPGVPGRLERRTRSAARDRANDRANDRARDAGVSLVEVMVVLAIIGVVSGAAVAMLGGGPLGADVDAEALRLAGRLQLAADEALLTGAARRLDWDANGYRFLDWNPEDGAWRAERRAVLAERHALPQGLILAGPNGASVLIAPDAGFQGTFVIRSEEATWAIRFDGLTARATLEAAR